MKKKIGVDTKKLGVTPIFSFLVFYFHSNKMSNEMEREREGAKRDLESELLLFICPAVVSRSNLFCRSKVKTKRKETKRNEKKLNK